MRYAIISDIHANIQAWNAVFQDILNVGVDQIVSLGDIVGYGPDPMRVIEACYANVHAFVMGNHDAAICDKMPLKRFSTDSRQIITWTSRQIDEAGMAFLSEQPFMLKTDNIIFTHASVDKPEEFPYLYQPQDCKPSWDACTEQLIFIGHTHIAGIHMIGEMGIPQWIPAQTIRISPDIRYVINVGSVGQPRDNDPRACYVLYDTSRKMIEFRRVVYDINTYLKRLHQVHMAVHPCIIESVMHSNIPQMTIALVPEEMPNVMGETGKIQSFNPSDNLPKPILSQTKMRAQRIDIPVPVESPAYPSKTTNRQPPVKTGKHTPSATSTSSIRGTGKHKPTGTGRHPTARTGPFSAVGSGKHPIVGPNHLSHLPEPEYETAGVTGARTGYVSSSGIRRRPISIQPVKTISTSTIILILLGILIVAIIVTIVILGQQVHQRSQEISSPSSRVSSSPSSSSSTEPPSYVQPVIRSPDSTPATPSVRRDTISGNRRVSQGPQIESNVSLGVKGMYVGNTQLVFGSFELGSSTPVEW